MADRKTWKRYAADCSPKDNQSCDKHRVSSQTPTSDRILRDRKRRPSDGQNTRSAENEAHTMGSRRNVRTKMAKGARQRKKGKTPGKVIQSHSGRNETKQTEFEGLSHQRSMTSSSDVAPDESSTDKGVRKEAQADENTQGERIPDSLIITDIEGRVLEPGDVLWVNTWCDRYYIYVGNQEVVRLEGWYPAYVMKSKLDLTKQIGKVTVTSEGECHIFPPSERVRRAESRIGTTFEEPGLYNSEFVIWVLTGMSLRMSKERGFRWER